MSSLCIPSPTISDPVVSDSDTLSLLHCHKKMAAWPPHDRNRPYSLPSLHTLHLDNFPDLLSHFHLPNVRFLGAYNILYRTFPGALYSAFAPASVAFSLSLTRFTFGSYASIPFKEIFNAFPHLTYLKVPLYCGSNDPPIHSAPRKQP